MKNNSYLKPEMKIKKYDIQDVITTSGGLIVDGDLDLGGGSVDGEGQMPDPISSSNIMN